MPYDIFILRSNSAGIVDEVFIHQKTLSLPSNKTAPGIYVLNQNPTYILLINNFQRRHLLTYPRPVGKQTKRINLNFGFENRESDLMCPHPKIYRFHLKSYSVHLDKCKRKFFFEKDKIGFLDIFIVLIKVQTKIQSYEKI